MYGSTFLSISMVALFTLIKATLCNYLNLNNLKVVLTQGFKALILTIKSYLIIPLDSGCNDKFGFSWYIESARTSSLKLVNYFNGLLFSILRRGFCRLFRTPASRSQHSWATLFFSVCLTLFVQLFIFLWSLSPSYLWQFFAGSHQEFFIYDEDYLRTEENTYSTYIFYFA